MSVKEKLPSAFGVLSAVSSLATTSSFSSMAIIVVPVTVPRMVRLEVGVVGVVLLLSPPSLPPHADNNSAIVTKHIFLRLRPISSSPLDNSKCLEKPR